MTWELEDDALGVFEKPVWIQLYIKRILYENGDDVSGTCIILIFI